MPTQTEKRLEIQDSRIRELIVIVRHMRGELDEQARVAANRDIESEATNWAIARMQNEMAKINDDLRSLATYVVGEVEEAHERKENDESQESQSPS